MAPLWGLALLLLCSGLHAGAAARRACEESGFCSAGVSQSWVGDIKDSDKLRDMLDKVAYKKELIISIFQEEGEPVWVEQVQQMHQELLSMGYAHHLFITLYEEACDMIKADTLSCVWDSSDLPGAVFGGETALWHNRWKLVGRASRLGYNVMSVDTDFIFFRDPYYHLKRPPFSNIQLLGAPEGGSNYNCNGGFVYVQNARPDGPVTWVFKQVVMSSLRRGDDKFEYMSKWSNSRTNCLTFDQSIIFDALAAAGVGRPVFPNALGSCKNSGAKFTSRAGPQLDFQQVADNVNHLVAAHMRTRTAKAPPDAEWLKSLGLTFIPEDDTHYIEGNLTVPNLSYGYPEELGGRFAPTELGPLSTAFTEQLKADCPDCPWWPEKRPLPAAGDPLPKLLGLEFKNPQITQENLNAHWDSSIKPELYAQGPRWFETSLVNVRRGWFLGQKSAVQGPQVMGHVHAWHMQTSRAHKTMLRKVLGRYNWTLGEHFAKATGHANPYLMHGPVTHVLALSPQIDLARTRNWSELSSIIVGLLQVAHLSNRVVLLPDLPCETAWLHDEGSLQDAQINRTVCLAPMFWRHPYRFPLPTPVPVDERGELLGGWARRRALQMQQQQQQQQRRHQQDTDTGSRTEWGSGSSGHGSRGHSNSVRSQQPWVAPLLLAPMHMADPQSLHGKRQSDSQAAAAPAAAGDVSGRGGSSRSGSSSRRRRRRQRLMTASSASSGGRALQGAEDEPVSPDWWAKQRFVAVMPQLWDASCTRDMQGIIGPEFFHWLKHSPHAKQVKLAPSAENTVLRVAAKQAQLQLQPPPPAGSLDSAEVPRGSVVAPSEQRGWSYKDVQAVLPALYVAKVLQEVADVPLVYLGHPVLVVHSHTRKRNKGSKQGAEAEAGMAAASETRPAGNALHVHADGSPMTADEVMARVDMHIRHSHCKAVWTQPETHNGEVVDLDAGVRANVEAGRLVVAP